MPSDFDTLHGENNNAMFSTHGQAVTYVSADGTQTPIPLAICGRQELSPMQQDDGRGRKMARVVRILAADVPVVSARATIEIDGVAWAITENVIVRPWGTICTCVRYEPVEKSGPGYRRNR